MNKTLKELLKSKRFRIQFGAVMDDSEVDYKYQINLVSVVPIAALVVVGIIAVVLGGVWLSVFSDTVQHWGAIDNLFSLTFALFMSFWLLGWSIGTFIALAALLIMLTGRQVVLVHSGRMETVLGIIGIGFKINLRAKEVINCRLTDADASAGSKTGRQIQIETDGGEDNSPFGREMTEQDLAKFKYAIDLNRNIESGLGDLPINPNRTVDDEQTGQPSRLLNEHLEAQENTNAGEPLTLTSPSTLLLVFANLVPLIGVLLLDWDLGSTMVLYWAETAIILFYAICKGFVRHGWLGLFAALFMLIHAGAFMSVHFLFIWSIFVEGFGNSTQFSGGNLNQVASYLISLWPALLALMVSHGFSFKVNFLDKLEHLKAQTRKPDNEDHSSFYSRIISMHFTIILGGGAAMILGSGVFALMMLIVLKIMADVHAHLKQHTTS